ncbi:MAG: iron chelate uptake ABC transporter family permease subunit [Actinomycetota bacterium]
MIAISAPSNSTLGFVVASLVVAAIVLAAAEMIPDRLRTLRWGNVSMLARMRILWIALIAIALVVALSVLGLIVGDFPIPRLDALATAIWDRGGEFDFIINTLRFPRVTVAILAGICLATSGAIFQALINNPLVSPDIIGIDTGAAVFAVGILATGGDVTYLPFAAFAGAVGTAFVIYSLAWRRGVSGARLVLIGIGINALLSAVITYITVRFPIERVIAAARWQAGTLFGASWSDARTLAIGLAILFPAAFLLVRRLRLLQLGDETAAGLGIRVERDRLLLIVVASGLAATAVAVVGPLSFVALLVPHLARLLTGPLTGGVLIVTALLGGAFLLGSDLIAQRLFAPTVLPAGIVTAALGGPYFLILLARYNRAL